MTTVYVVTTGAYSDKGNHAVFSKKEDAELVCKQLSESEYAYVGIEEHELDSHPVQQPRAPRWYICFAPNGDDKIWTSRLTEFGTDEEQGVNEFGSFWTYVDTDDQEYAETVAKQRYGQWLLKHPIRRKWHTVFDLETLGLLRVSRAANYSTVGLTGIYGNTGLYAIVEAGTEQEAIDVAREQVKKWRENNDEPNH